MNVADRHPREEVGAEARLQARVGVDALDHARVEAEAGGEGEAAAVDDAEVDLARAPVVGHREQVLGRVDEVAGDAEHLAEHVGRAARQAAQRGGGAEQAVGGFVDRAVAAEGDDDVVALVRGLAAELGRVAARLGVDRVDLEAALQRVDDEVAQAVGDGRRVRVDDDQHPPPGWPAEAKRKGSSALGRYARPASRVEVLIGKAYTARAAALPAASVQALRCGLRSPRWLLDCRADIAGHIQRGGGTGPMKPRQPPSRHGGKVPIPERCVAGFVLFATPVTRRRLERRSPNGCQSSAVQGVQGGVSAARRCTCASAASGRSRSPTTTAASSRDVGELRRRIQGGPQNIWRYADFLPLGGRSSRPSGRLASRVGPAGGLHAADPRRPAGRAPRPARGVGQERRRQPDPLVQGPRRLGRRRARARAGLRDDRLRLDRQPRQLGGRPRGGAGAGVLRLHPRRPRGAEGARDRRLRHQARRAWTAATTTSTACAPSCAPSATGRS